MIVFRPNELANDADYLLRIADRVASRIKVPPTMERADIVQDAVMHAITLLRSGWQPPDRFPADLALVLAVRRRLGARAAYRSEWQWARRHLPARTDDVDEAFGAASPPPTPDDPVADIIDALPAHLRAIARVMLADALSAKPTRWSWTKLAAKLGCTRRVAEALARDFEASLRRENLWHDGFFPAPRPSRKRNNES